MFAISNWSFDLSSMFIPESKKVWFFTRGTGFFIFYYGTYPTQWLTITGRCLSWGLQKAPKEFPGVIRLLCLFFVNLHLLVQCQTLPHSQKDWAFSILPFTKETLLLGLHWLHYLPRCVIVPQLIHLTFQIPFLRLEIAYPTQTTVMYLSVSTLIVHKNPFYAFVADLIFSCQESFCILYCHFQKQEIHFILI